MEYKQIGDSNVSVIGFGTHLVGGKAEADYSKDDYYIETIRKAIDLGINHIDTAEIYGKGHAEEIIGKAIKNTDRKNSFIASKVWSTNLKPEDLFKSLKGSLSRFNTEYIDLYYIHWPNPEINLKDTMLALEKAKDMGLIKNIGLSNFSVELIKEAQSYISSKIAAIQVEYSLLNQDPKKELLKFCEKENIMLVAYTPLGKGAVLNAESKLLDTLCTKYKKTKAQIALNWLIYQKNVVAIPRMSLNHLEENLGALNWKLNEEDYNKLASI